MASLKEIKGRIASVRSTLKITSAMKLVASAKLRKAQQAITNMLPYERQLQSIFGRLMVACPDAGALGAGAPSDSGRVAIVAFSSNSSLCGAFNSNVIRKTLGVIDEYRSAGFSDGDIFVYSVGRKMAEAMRKAGFPSPADYSKMAESPGYEAASALAQELIEGFASGHFSKVELVYNHFKSTASQPTVRETYLPMVADAYSGSPDSLSPDCAQPPSRINSPFSAESPALSTTSGQGSMSQSAANYGRLDRPSAEPIPDDIIIEPSREELFAELLPKVQRLRIFTTLLDSNAAEHAARTVAMQTATDNGNDLLEQLTLEYNKGRQQKITSEILDIVGGSLQ